MSADALVFSLAFVFARALSLLGSRSFELRLRIFLRLRLRFRLGLQDDLSVVTVRA